MVTVREIVEVMDAIAPRYLAETWDNVGLQVGHNDWPVKRIGVALDPSYGVIDTACDDELDLVVTHHPLIFRALHSVDVGDPVGRAIQRALESRLAIFCAHTNLDSARDGLNDILARRIGLKSVQVLKAAETGCYRSVVYVPKGDEERLIHGLFDAGFGQGNRYSCLSFRTRGTGTFLPGHDAKPVMGRRGELTEAEEFRVEITVEAHELRRFEKVLDRLHPYEEIVYDLYPVQGIKGHCGLGRVGDLSEPMCFGDFVANLKACFNLSTVKTIGDPKQSIAHVAVCGGSGRSVVSAFLASRAEVLVTGDVGYHDGQQVAEVGKCLVDIGHFASEYVVVEGLCNKLSMSLADLDDEIAVVACSGERDCFSYR